MTSEHGVPKLCIIHTGRAVPQMLLGGGWDRAGGAELQLSEIARRLRQRGWPVTFALYDDRNGAERATDDGIRLLSAAPPAGGLPGLRFLTHTVPTNWHLITRGDADVYLQMGVGWQNALLAWRCRSESRRFVLWLASITGPLCDDPRHSRLAAHERWLARYGLRHADVIVAQTRDQQALLRQRHGRDSVLIRNIWGPSSSDVACPADPPEVFWAATMRGLKRPHMFLDVAEALPEMRFVMAGGPADEDGGLYDEVKRRAQGISNVDFLGFVPFREIDKYYARASAYLCTSTIEGFPNTFLQSWSHGRPVVSTFDPDGVISAHDLGFHCRDADELVPAVEVACENTTDYVQRTRDYLRRNHSPEVIMPQVETVLFGEQPRGGSSSDDSAWGDAMRET